MKFAAAWGRRFGRATPSLRSDPMRHTMEPTGRRSTYRSRNAVSTRPSTSDSGFCDETADFGALEAEARASRAAASLTIRQLHEALGALFPTQEPQSLAGESTANPTRGGLIPFATEPEDEQRVPVPPPPATPNNEALTLVEHSAALSVGAEAIPHLIDEALRHVPGIPEAQLDLEQLRAVPETTEVPDQAVLANDLEDSGRIGTSPPAPETAVALTTATGETLQGGRLADHWRGRRDLFGLLYWLARTGEAGPVSVTDLPVADAFHAFLLGIGVLGGEEELAIELQGAAERVFDRLDEPSPPELLLLLPAALVSQQIGHGFLARIEAAHAPQHLARVFDASAEWIRTGLELRPSVLHRLRSHLSREDQAAALRSAAERWLEEARHRTMKYQPATAVWQEWVGESGGIGAAMGRLSSGKFAPEEAESAARDWSDTTRIREQIESVDRQLRSPHAPAIVGSPVQALERNAVQAAEMFAQAVSLLRGTEPASRADAAKLDQLKRAVFEAVPLCESAPLAKRALEELGVALTADNSRQTLTTLRIAESLLLLPDIPLDAALQPAEPLPSAPVFARQLESSVPPAVAAVIRARRGETHASEAALSLLELSCTDGQMVEDCRDECQRQLETWVMRTDAQRAMLTRRFERDQALDLLSSNATTEVEQLLDMAARATRESASTSAWLDQAAKVLDSCESSFAEGLRNRRRQVSLREPHTNESLALVDGALASGDLERAEEHLQLLETGRPLSGAFENPKLPSELFQSFLLRYQTSGLATERIAPDTLIREHLSKLIGGISEADLSPARAVIAAWRDAQARSGFVREEVSEVLRFLGFRGKLTQPGSAQHFRLQSEPLKSVLDCPMHQFGSSAAGRYDIIIEASPTTAERLLKRVEDAGVPPEAAAIVFTPKPLSDGLRRGLLKLLIPSQRRVIVLDEVLLLFLATQPAPRLGTFFRCALPWSGLQPYITRPGTTLPPELFVGRVEERQKVEDRSGPCLVYGGRQLGKTALLREIERAHQAMGEDRITFWIDLNGLGIEADGTTPLERVWQEIGHRLRARGIREADLGIPQLFTGVEKWLREQESKRRILVLLDETDDFIEADGRDDFKQLRLMKGLMDRTEQRFKIVFTGLHNVQRASHQVNTPVAHLGDPVCIGPLHGRAEAEEAWRLIVEPLAARGFTFDPPDLPMRILARANYYPNLIQLICSELVEVLNARGRVPPGRITEEELGEALDSRDLRKQLQDRFLRTLGLDKRYHLLALCLADHALNDPLDRRLIDGFDPSWFAAQAREYWPEGFPDGASPVVVRTLLEEMAGLGVLAERDNGGFVLRTPNLRALIGNRTQISEALSSFIGRPAPAPYAPGTFRRRLGDDGADPRRSPLSMHDEGELFARNHGVVVVSGLELAGLNRLSAGIEQALPAQGARFWPHSFGNGPLDSSELRRVIDAAMRNAASGVNLVLVPQDVVWDSDLPFVAMELLAKRPERERMLRLIFPADARAAWRWRQRAAGSATTVQNLRIRDVTLTPWTMETLRRWAEDTGAPGASDAAERRALWDACGGFGPVLELMADCGHRHPAELPGEALQRLFASNPEPLGDWPTPLRCAFHAWAELLSDPNTGEISDCDDIDLMAEAAEITRGEAVQMLDWAEWVGVGTVLPGRQYRLNPLVARVLLHGG